MQPGGPPKLSLTCHEQYLPGCRSDVHSDVRRKGNIEYAIPDGLCCQHMVICDIEMDDSVVLGQAYEHK